MKRPNDPPPPPAPGLPLRHQRGPGAVETPAPAAAPVLTFGALARWDELRRVAVEGRPILAPAVDRIAAWPVPPGVPVTAALLCDLAVVFLNHAPLDTLRGASMSRRRSKPSQSPGPFTALRRARPCSKSSPPGTCTR